MARRWLGTISLGLMVFEVSKTDNLGSQFDIATVLLTLATIAAIANIAVITMLKFAFENHGFQPKRIDFLFLLSPLVLLDLIIVSVLTGLFLLFNSILPSWFGAIAGAQLVFFLVFMLTVSVLVWKRVRVPNETDDGKTSQD
ncbi:uncharacterized protein NECHADRAFT_88480 [Fusarium vanettenii 77-13-4]|uniref:Uncharacterized protein n=1 Tax=Fusarium vanettenii (strain ATCC MYA-4622 / CBS 123669 / FGSC 9596 / NRRL 45880 / 77-13-4) TaxID=660122 RepID=C7ZBP2_FUSV7|nr:uncharacterized protein NECHADRAFT_88480 [Fusarium vanettenii 77-13-4]EEU38601.1 predicted protein [Fusarium vanettenii 77-13-4]